ncbi:MAG TPA: alanine racemase [Candidatus Alistipes intestinigallinarum]|uniref:Alanine racemase n=1 Tax=Candidatus Alistipes intestinigallinarum TaxID=2838440 RepID=A0A9D1Z523_9BACT|nr:alanine racemase [Candidatus Alistipes intestinigallinarum]
MNYRLSQIAAVVGGRFSGEDRDVRSVVTDSRSLSCELGCDPMFVAMCGANHDSHRFLSEMYARGVRAFLVERPVEAMPECGYVVVKNAIAALQSLAAFHRARFKGTVVGITGSNGKTVIKEWIAEELPAGMKCYRSPKSYNSQLGVPLSVLMIEGDEQLALIEAGISKPGEMERLERIIRPDVVVFTSIGDAHQENFLNLEQKCLEKMVLAHRARMIVYHSHYEPLGHLIASRFAERKLFDAAAAPQLPEAVIGNEASRRNAQIVEAFCSAMGFPAPSFSAAPQVAMRLEVKDGINDSVLINDAYNLDLNSLALALDYLHSVALTRRRTLVLSDIAQSGLSDDELYGRVAGMVARAGIDTLVGIGPKLKRYAALFDCDKVFYASTDECIARIGRRVVAGRAVLLKGARDFRFEKLAHALSCKSHTTVLEVDLDAMTHNLNYFRSKLDFRTKLVAMVKAGSYGAGDFEVAQMLQHQRVDYLAVAFADEGVLLRERGITMPIVVLNADADSFDQMIANRLEPEIYSFRSLDDFARAVNHAGEIRYPIHVKLDTGMHRLGFMEGEIGRLCDVLKELPAVKVASVFSHLNCADMPEEDAYTRAQIDRYDRMSTQLVEALPYAVIRHTANSAAIERFPEAQFDMCRLGLGLYGFGWQHNPALRPVSALKTRIVQIKHLEAGDAVGYGRAGRLTRPTVTATVPIGYADGLDRHLGCGRWSMLVAGQPAPIVGRVCMDSCMIDITDIPGVEEGDEAVVFSAAPGNDLETMADVLGTIPYEIMTSVSGRVKRIYLKE